MASVFCRWSDALISCGLGEPCSRLSRSPSLLLPQLTRTAAASRGLVGFGYGQVPDIPPPPLHPRGGRGGWQPLSFANVKKTATDAGSQVVPWCRKTGFVGSLKSLWLQE